MHADLIMHLFLRRRCVVPEPLTALDANYCFAMTWVGCHFYSWHPLDSWAVKSTVVPTLHKEENWFVILLHVILEIFWHLVSYQSHRPCTNTSFQRQCHRSHKSNTVQTSLHPIRYGDFVIDVHSYYAYASRMCLRHRYEYGFKISDLASLDEFQACVAWLVFWWVDGDKASGE